MNSFWDSSSIISLCTPEESSEAMRAQLASGEFTVWWATRVEVTSGLERRRRAGLPPAQCAASIAILADLSEQWTEIAPSEGVRELAALQLLRFDLRAADAFQLAAALVWCDERPRGRQFICNDRKLSAAARELGFTIISSY